jgi:hypothetical protein
MSNRAISWFASLSSLSLAVGLLTSGCSWGDKNEQWLENLGDPEAVGLSGSVVLHDQRLERLLFVSSKKVNSLDVTALPLGKNVTTMLPSQDRSQLFVLSRGVFPRIDDEDEGPQLSVFDGGTEPEQIRSFELDDPMTKLSLDPQGEWVAAYAGDATVTNPNELVLLELASSDSSTRSKTIRSFGGAPEELLFTDELLVPRGGKRRFVIVRTDRDITLVDLDHLSRDEVTVRLGESSNGVTPSPAQIVYDDGDPERDDDARIAIRLTGSSDVMILQLLPSEDEDRDFSVTPNIVDVGGVPSTIDFVRTDGGLRLAALVPGLQRATLVNPETTLAEKVDLPAGFDRMTRITKDLGEESADGDVALLYGATNQIAFWSLGSTSATPFRSIDATGLNLTVSSVLDVPAPNDHLKVLVGPTGDDFYVLDLLKRQSFPLHTQGSGFTVEPTSDGERVWISRPGTHQFSAVFLEDLHPSEVYVQPLVSFVFDIERKDGGRSAIALHTDDGDWAATVLDANDPNSSQTAFYPALFWEDMQ